ncbi:MAG TPA: hypothetical protein PLD10_24920, partial [Rhodopila sp.]|nr:hypothetical protein [Rhodopila sp.]
MSTRTGVHDPPESAFMINRIRRSQSNGIDVHNQPERADRLHFAALWNAANCLVRRKSLSITLRAAVAAGCLDAEFKPQTQPNWDRLGGW